MPKPFTAWSYSRWDLHHTCPLRFKLEIIDGFKSPENDAMAAGQKMHRAAEQYLKAQVKPEATPAEMKFQQAFISELWDFDNRVTEQQWGYDRNWGATGWFGDTTWFRSVVDVALIYDDLTAEVIDWKSGKPRDTHEDQMELFAMSVMLRQQPVTHVTTRLAYTDVKDVAEFGEYPRSDLDKLVAKWTEKARPMFEDTTYLPRPNDKCKFCQFARSATGEHGGKCRYG